jgi:hypothetical protein
MYFFAVPQGIGTRAPSSKDYLVEGMLLNDGEYITFDYLSYLSLDSVFFIEPGFYKDNEFGIRIENCVLAVTQQSKGDIYLVPLIFDFILIFKF